MEKTPTFNPVKIQTKATTQQQAPQAAAENAKAGNNNDTAYLFNQQTPWSHATGKVAPATRRKAGIAGFVFAAAVVGIYAYTLHNMKQQDFSDVLVPDAVREKYKEHDAKQ